MSDKKFYLAVAILIFLAVGVLGGVYFNVSSLKKHNANPVIEARRAVQNHDLDTFYKYVDLDRVLARAAEQILAAQINDTLAPTAYSFDELRLRYDNLKPVFINTARNAVEQYITGGDVDFNDDDFFSAAGVAHCRIKSITKPKADAGGQVVNVIFYNSLLKFNFELELHLVGGHVVDADGFDSFYRGYKRALKRRRDAQNAAIAAKINELFHVKRFSIAAGHGDEYGFSRDLLITLEADVAQPLASVSGNILFAEHPTPFTINNVPKGIHSFTLTKTLNPFVRGDAHALRHGFKKSDFSFEITRISFYDSDSIELFSD